MIWCLDLRQADRLAYNEKRGSPAKEKVLRLIAVFNE